MLSIWMLRCSPSKQNIHFLGCSRDPSLHFMYSNPVLKMPRCRSHLYHMNMQCTIEHLLLVFKWTASNYGIHLGYKRPRFSFSNDLDNYTSFWLTGCSGVGLLVSRKFSLRLRDVHDSWHVLLRHVTGNSSSKKVHQFFWTLLKRYYRTIFHSTCNQTVETMATVQNMMI